MGESREELRTGPESAHSHPAERAQTGRETQPGLIGLQQTAGNRATADLVARRTQVQRHPLPTPESEWQPPESPPGIWEWLTSLFGSGSGGGSAGTPGDGGGGSTPPPDTTGAPSTGGTGGTAPTTSTETPPTGGTGTPPTGGSTSTSTPSTGGTGGTTTTPSSEGTTTATPSTGGTTTATPTTGSGTTTGAPTTGGATASPGPTSLTSGASFTAYANAAQTIKTNWNTYPNADARGQALGQAAISALTSVNVHPPTVTMADLPAGNGGNFGFSGWTLTLARLPFQPATVSDAVFDNPYTAVYHEARHCEQWYRMARLRAGAGRTADQIRTEMGIAASAASAAFANPIAAGSAEAAEATVWWNSVYGTGASNRNAVLTEVMAALTALNSARSADAAGSTPATQATLTTAQTRFTTAYAAYRALPEEADAFGTETQLRTALTAAAASTGATTGGATPTAPSGTPPPSTGGSSGTPTPTPTPTPSG